MELLFSEEYPAVYIELTMFVSVMLFNPILKRETISQLMPDSWIYMHAQGLQSYQTLRVISYVLEYTTCYTIARGMGELLASTCLPVLSGAIYFGNQFEVCLLLQSI